MKKFRFKLQTVLDQRQAVEDRLMEELAVLRQEEAVELQKLEDLHTELSEATAEMERALARKFACGELARCDEYAKSVRDDIKLQELTIEAVKERIEQKLEEVVEAMKQRKVLEALRDKQEREYMLAMEREQQKQLDDISSTRYARGI